MSGRLNLCKIADLATDTDSETQAKENIYSIDGKMWKAIFTCDEMKEILSCNDVCTTQSEDGRSLYASLPLTGGKECTVDLFSIVFENYTEEDELIPFDSIGLLSQTKQIKIHITNKFYDALLSSQEKSRVVFNKRYLPKTFLPTLCHYQERTVNWLLHREQSPGQLIYYKKLQAKDGVTCVFKHLYCARFYEQTPPDIPLPPGGILADEMGLGKTVMLLALVLLHKRKPKDLKLSKPIYVAEDEEDSDCEEVSPPKKSRKDVNLHCVCGVDKNRGDKLVNCQKCKLWQHVGCVCKFDVEHSSDINEPYLCPPCFNECIGDKLVPSRATLIVTPPTIRTQWLNEIKRHISADLRVFNYNGTSNKLWMSPRQLADYDIVLTDYNVLKREVYYTKDQDTGRVLRQRTRSLRIFTPLLMIEWWRCCLDEAQMTESDVSRMATLVRSIPAVNRWAVSGTPIQRSIDDLYPLLRFIGMEDFIDTSLWSDLASNFMQNCDKSGINLSTLPLIEILTNFMWRTGKQQVQNELPIPPQTEILHTIQLSDLERLYYNEQHKECKEDFEDTLRKYFQASSLVLSSSHHLMSFIMRPLLKIRMCCTIPTINAPKNHHALTGVIQKQFLQPKELSAHLLNRNKVDCKHHLRSIASAHNGIAAIYFIQGKHSEAVDSYEKVLKLANEYAADKSLSVDTLLQIHALYNILQARNCSPTLKKKRSKETFEQYELQLNTLEWKYLETYASQLCRVNQTFDKTRNALQSKTQSLDEDLLSFVSNLLDIEDSNLQTQLLAKILEECIRKFGVLRLEAASSLRGVLLILSMWFDKLVKLQNEIIAAFDELKFFATNIKPRSEVSPQTWRSVSHFITSVCDCHIIELRELQESENDPKGAHNIKRTSRERAGKNACKLCKLIDKINSFECLLFKKSIDLATNVVEGDESPQMEIEMIKIIFNFLKPKRSYMAADMENHFAVLQSMQSFCKAAIKFWIEIEFTVKAYDELDMCNMRTTLTEDPAERNNYKILPHELELNFVRQEQLLKYSKHCFDLKYARLKYIKRLDTDTDIGACPICQSDDEKRHAFLICGHQVCLNCYKFMTSINHSSRITCSICRNEQPTECVYFMTTTNKVQEKNQGETIRGDYSAKMTYIVQLLKKLLREHHKENNTTVLNDALDASHANDDDFPLKVLIFSQWPLVLSALAAALTENDITYSHSKTRNSIEHFRKPDSGKTCLLMPLAKGCKGLNLIEATHVFLVEPVLNPSEELQAIGRVHRFGQTRPTTVHRFIVEDTVEKNLYELVSTGKSHSKDWQFENITIENLRMLFAQARN